MKVVLFGAGKRLSKLIDKKKFDGYEVLAVLDNDDEKIGGTVAIGAINVPVVSAYKIENYAYEYVILTAENIKIRMAMSEQLIAMGVSGRCIKYVSGERLLQQPWMKNELYTVNAKSIIWDVTNIASNDSKTGIPRTVNNLYNNLRKTDVEVEPVQWVGKYITANSYTSRFIDKEYDGGESYISLKANNRIILPDTAWLQGKELLIELKKMKVQSFVFIYDLIPILETEIWGDNDISVFKNWIDGTMQYADNILCISKTVANDVIEYYKKNNVHRKEKLKSYDFHLGFDIPKTELHVRNEIRDFVARRCTFLMVGVLGPQKNHLLALQAIKNYNIKHNKKPVQLLILGRDAYDNQHFKELYYSDSTIKESVLWFDDADDGELQWAYQHCSALLFPTKNEGFGLPLVEAASYGLPIICSDIPIFRELADDNADYFKVNDVDALEEALLLWVRKEKHPNSNKIKLYSWSDAADDVMSIIEGIKKPYAVLC